MHAKRLETSQCRDRPLEIVDQYPLGNLELQLVRRKTGVEKDRLHEIRKIKVIIKEISTACGTIRKTERR